MNGSKKSEKNSIALEVKELPEHVKYDGGWYNELDELKRSLDSMLQPLDVTHFNNALRTPFRETTPRGDIIMYYDGETKSFNYYSNSKNIPYSTLDAVARKYVCLNKNPSIYIDIRDEVQKGREKCFKQNKENTLKLEKNKSESGSGMLSSAKKSLFAVFKNYKTGRNYQKSIGDGKMEIVVMKENINKFVYKGTLEQYDADLKHKKHCELIKNAEYADYANACESVKKVDDHVELHHEKQDISYTEFKKKYNH
jgi:hypothetical protein